MQNTRKHGIEFVNAVIVFDDGRAIALADEHPPGRALCYVWRGRSGTGIGSFLYGTGKHDSNNISSKGDFARTSSIRGKADMKRQYDLSAGKRGRVIPLPQEKVRITIRLDRDVLEYFRDQVRKAHRGNYQTLINDALRDHIQRPGLAQQVGAEVRSILRDELGKMKANA